MTPTAIDSWDSQNISFQCLTLGLVLPDLNVSSKVVKMFLIDLHLDNLLCLAVGLTV